LTPRGKRKTHGIKDEWHILARVIHQTLYMRATRTRQIAASAATTDAGVPKGTLMREERARREVSVIVARNEGLVNNPG
jgi:hypothetical protein